MTNSSAHESQVSLKPEKKRPTEAQMVQIQKDRNISRYVNGFILINEINQLFSNQNRQASYNSRHYQHMYKEFSFTLCFGEGDE